MKMKHSQLLDGKSFFPGYFNLKLFHHGIPQAFRKPSAHLLWNTILSSTERASPADRLIPFIPFGLNSQVGFIMVYC